MQAYDLIMLIVIGMATIFGAIKGFAWQVASLASIIVSYIVAYRFRFDVAEMIQAKPPWNQFLAMLILYVGTSFVIWVGFRLLSGTIDRVRLKEFDRHLGAAFGLAKGLVYCLLITMFATSLLGPNQQAAICHSRSGYYIATALDRGVGILPKEIHDVVGPYLARLDDKLKSGGATAGAADSGGLTWPGGLQGIPAIPEGLQNGIQQFLPGANNAAQLNPGNWGQAGAAVAGFSGSILPGNTASGNTGPGNVLPGNLVPGTVTPGTVTPGNVAVFPNSAIPGTSGLPGFGSGNFESANIFPPAAGQNTGAQDTGVRAPQIFPPLGSPGSLPADGGAGLRPSGVRTGQQVQPPEYALPR